MVFFIDFEAAQFSDQIISIGCVTLTNQQFYSLARPREVSITKFTTALTGITREMLLNAPTTAEAFTNLYRFINSHKDDENIFYTFSTTDKHFLSRTIAKMEKHDIISFMKELSCSLVDFSTITAVDLGANRGLSKLYQALYDREYQQTHNALDDAKILRKIYQWLAYASDDDKKSALDRLNKLYLSTNPKLAQTMDLKKKSAPPLFIEWNNYNMHTAPTGATKDDYLVCGYNDAGEYFYFKDFETAALWVCKFISRGSPKKESHLSKLQKGIRRAIAGGFSYQTLYWKQK